MAIAKASALFRTLPDFLSAMLPGPDPAVGPSILSTGSLNRFSPGGQDGHPSASFLLAAAPPITYADLLNERYMNEFSRPTRWAKAKAITSISLREEVIAALITAGVYIVLRSWNPSFDSVDLAFTMVSGLSGAILYGLGSFARNLIRAARLISDDAADYYRNAALKSTAEAEVLRRAVGDNWAEIEQRFLIFKDSPCTAELREKEGKEEWEVRCDARVYEDIRSICSLAVSTLVSDAPYVPELPQSVLQPGDAIDRWLFFLRYLGFAQKTDADAMYNPNDPAQRQIRHVISASALACVEWRARLLSLSMSQ